MNAGASPRAVRVRNVDVGARAAGKRYKRVSDWIAICGSVQGQSADVQMRMGAGLDMSLRGSHLLLDGLGLRNNKRHTCL